MAKGRSAKAKETSDDCTKEATKKVSDTEEPTLVSNGGEENEEEEVWDIVHVAVEGKDETCRTDGCEQVAVATWATNKVPDEKWPLCEACQEKDFGGWPEGFERHAESSKPTDAVEPSNDTTLESPTNEKDVEEGTSMDVDSKDVVMEGDDTPKEGTEATSEVHANDDEEDPSDPNDEGEDEEEDEKWDLKKILSHAAVTKEGPIKCSTEDCLLPACCLYVSSTRAEKWYSCIDCQESDFGGWPPIEELPVTSLDKDHIQALVDKCSKKKRPAMPPFADSLSPMKPNAEGTATNPITPLTGNALQAPEGSKATITPTPGKVTKPKPNPKQNAAFVKKHAEWQQAAIKAGGPEARIVVKKDLAKPIIFDVLYEAFKPMNITQIHAVSFIRVCPI